MKAHQIISLFIFAVLFVSCSKTPLQKKYDSSNINKDLSDIESTIGEADFDYLTVLLDSLPSEALQGNTYEEILKEGKKGNTVYDRFEKRYLKKNKVKKLGKRLGKKESESTSEE